jgi:hypothetical protein
VTFYTKASAKLSRSDIFRATEVGDCMADIVQQLPL